MELNNSDSPFSDTSSGLRGVHDQLRLEGIGFGDYLGGVDRLLLLLFLGVGLQFIEKLTSKDVLLAMAPVQIELLLFRGPSLDFGTVFEHNAEHLGHHSNTRSHFVESFQFCHMIISQSSDSLHSFLEDRHDLSEFLITISGNLISIGLLLLGHVFFDGTGSLFDFDFLTLDFNFNLLFGGGFSLKLDLRHQNSQVDLQLLYSDGCFVKRNESTLILADGVSDHMTLGG